MNESEKVMNGKKLEDNEKIRSLTRTLQNQIKQASKKEIMGGSTSRRRSVLLFARDNILIFLIIVISAFSIYNFWFTHNFWKLVRKRNVLTPNSRAYRMFEHVPMENMKLCINIFNYTNVGEAMNSSVPFKVESLGPYCFRDTPNKKNIAFNEDETEISYQEDSSVEFLPEESNGTLDDRVVVPNIPLLSVFHQVLQHSFVIRYAMVAKIKLNKYEPFIPLRVSDLLLGYDDELLEWIYKITQTIGIAIPMRRFALLERIMNNINANYTIDTGKADISKLGDIKLYNGEPSLPFWNSAECNAFDGAYGAYWRPEAVRAGRNMSFLNGYLCRKVQLVKATDAKYAHVIPVSRYESSPDLFAYPTQPEDSCYCVSNDLCIDNLHDVGHCLGGPFVLSYRNFHGVDREVLSHIDFEKLETPKDDDWKTTFDIHAGLGNTLSFKTTFQMNVQVKKKNDLDLVEFPMKLENGLILPAVVIERCGPRLDSTTTQLLILLTLLEATLQYGSLVLPLALLYILIRRWRTLYEPCLVHRVSVAPPITLYQQTLITNANEKIYSQL